MSPSLITIDEAAAELGVPKGSLETAARAHGFLVCMGRARRIDPESLPELIELCREKPQERDSTNAVTASSRSATVPDSSQRALEIAEKLKRRSPAISRNGTAPLAAQLHQIK